jgi:hypothetical protein
MVDRLIDGERDDEWLGAHRLLPLVAERRHQRGLAVTDRQRTVARAVAADHVIAEHLLAEVRDAVSGRVLVLKGPELAAVYERSGLRPFADVDVLVEEADAAVVELAAAGFGGDPPDGRDHDDHHHLPPLRREPLRMPVEVHLRPGWVPWSKAPGWPELAAAAAPSLTGVRGVERPSDPHHAVLVAVHGWSRRPYGRLLDLADVWLLGQRAGPEEAATVAEQWGVGRLWRASWAAAEALVTGASLPRAARLLGRHLWGRSAPPGPSRARLVASLLVTAPPRALPGLALRGPAAVVRRSPVRSGRR